MRPLPFLLVALLAAPVAAAGPVADGCYASDACISESEQGDPSCENGSYHAQTQVTVAGAVDARGWRQCFTMADGRSGGAQGIVIFTPVTVVMWLEAHVEDDGVCFVAVTPLAAPCPAPPPPLPWGALLP